MHSTTETRENDSADLPGATGSPPSGPLTVDETFEILKNRRRRLVLEYLQGVEGVVELSTLADHVTAIENDTDVEAITSEERKRVYVALYQFHLSKMADMGVIDYDQDRGRIELTDKGRQLLREHDQRASLDWRWHVAYTALAVVGLLAVTLSLGFWVPALILGVLALQSLLLLAVTLAHVSTVKRCSLSN